MFFFNSKNPKVSGPFDLMVHQIQNYSKKQNSFTLMVGTLLFLKKLYYTFMTMQAEIETDHKVVFFFFENTEKCFGFFSKQAKMVCFIQWDKIQVFNFVLHLHFYFLTSVQIEHAISVWLFFLTKRYVSLYYIIIQI